MSVSAIGSRIQRPKTGQLRYLKIILNRWWRYFGLETFESFENIPSVELEVSMISLDGAGLKYYIRTDHV